MRRIVILTLVPGGGVAIWRSKILAATLLLLYITYDGMAQIEEKLLRIFMKEDEESNGESNGRGFRVLKERLAMESGERSQGLRAFFFYVLSALDNESLFFVVSVLRFFSLSFGLSTIHVGFLLPARKER